jgi:DNA-binding transcriptional regulator YiaG
MDGTITSIDILKFREAMGLSVEDFAQLMGVKSVTIYRWEDNLPKNFKPQNLTTLRNLLEDLVAEGSISLS